MHHINSILAHRAITILGHIPAMMAILRSMRAPPIYRTIWIKSTHPMRLTTFLHHPQTRKPQSMQAKSRLTKIWNLRIIMVRTQFTRRRLTTTGTTRLKKRIRPPQPQEDGPTSNFQRSDSELALHDGQVRKSAELPTSQFIAHRDQTILLVNWFTL
ncbi:hypothetical protein B0O99DRAFT_605527 [Bisporella sp. PMI_857]|nr:hypothetical protein B0O99DRAFT_605527 [Bisporella sp. PMI_857]